MDKKTLEVNKLFKELDYLNADLEYKQECMDEANQKFIQQIGKTIEQREDIRIADDSSTNKRIDLGKLKLKKNIDQKAKDVFRKIAKKTHPDVTEDLSEYYLRASEHYKNNDILSLYLICNDLKIDFEFKEDDTNLIKEKINKIKASIDFIECSYAWQWNISNTDKEKEAIIELYIKDNL